MTEEVYKRPMFTTPAYRLPTPPPPAFSFLIRVFLNRLVPPGNPPVAVQVQQAAAAGRRSTAGGRPRRLCEHAPGEPITRPAPPPAPPRHAVGPFYGGPLLDGLLF